MINFSQSTAIALHAMIYIANRAGKVISLKEIAEAFNISPNHLSKVLQHLVKAEFLVSVKGPGGGFQIIADKTDTTFFQIYETIEGKALKKACLFISKKEDCKNCIMGGLIPKFNKEIIDYMKSHKITDFKL